MPVHNGTITGQAIGGFQAVVILSAIDLYLKTGMQVNRAYTPANMRAAASQYTGKAYPRSRKGLEQASLDLHELKAKADQTSCPLDILGAVEEQVRETGGPVDIIVIPKTGLT